MNNTTGVWAAGLQCYPVGVSVNEWLSEGGTQIVVLGTVVGLVASPHYIHLWNPTHPTQIDNVITKHKRLSLNKVNVKTNEKGQGQCPNYIHFWNPTHPTHNDKVITKHKLLSLNKVNVKTNEKGQGQNKWKRSRSMPKLHSLLKPHTPYTQW